MFEDCEDRSASVGAVLVRRVRFGAESMDDFEGSASCVVVVCSVGLVDGVTVVLVACGTGTARELDELVRLEEDF